MRIPPSGCKFLRLSSTMFLVIFWVHVLSSFATSSAAIPTSWKTWNIWFHGGASDPETNAASYTQSSSSYLGLWKNETSTDTNINDRDFSPSEILSFEEDVVNPAVVKKRAEMKMKTELDSDTTNATNPNANETLSSSLNSTANNIPEVVTSLRNTMTEKKQEFFDRIALVSSSLMRRERDAHLKRDVSNNAHATDLVTPQSDLTLPGRHMHIVTTASLPWFTGTAVNPLLRAAYLHRRTREINKNHPASGNHTNEMRWVTLVIPWLELPEDQQALYGRVFDNEQAQEDYIRAWLREEAGMPDVACPDTGLQMIFYPARYHADLGSIFAMGDIISLLPPDKMDVCVLEEVEHLNWFRAPGDGWTKRFQFVVGIVHTNYKEYASSHYTGLWTAPAISMLSSAMVRAYCHKVIKLSSSLQTYAPEKESVSNVHGVRADFLKEGMRRAEHARLHGDDVVDPAVTRVYYIGKLLWAKGLDIMLELEDYYKQCTNKYFAIDIYGSGPDQKDITKAFHGRRKLGEEATGRSTTGNANGSSRMSIMRTALSLGGGTADASASTGPTASDESASDGDYEGSESASLDALHVIAKQRLEKIKKTINAVELPKTFSELRRQPIPATFPGRVDHGTLTKQYTVFVNPSLSEVLCTTTAEALAMGKFAIIPLHPSNTFFLQFPNCLAYRTKFEFVANLRWALTHEPTPLTPELARHFSWEAATDRFIEASAVTWGQAYERERLGLSKLDERIAWFHNEIGKGATGDMLRKFFGAGPVSGQVQYVTNKQGAVLVAAEDGEEGQGTDGDEDEDDGLSSKFRRSAFADALRSTIGDFSSFLR